MKQFFGALFIFLGTTVAGIAQSAPKGSDNIGGVSAPAGTFDFSPSVTQVGLNPYTGNATRVSEDLKVASVSEVGLKFIRYYNSRGNPGSFQMGNGAGWRYNYQWDFSLATVNGVSTINLVYPNGTKVTFTETGANTWSAPSPVFDTITLNGTSYFLTTSTHIQYVFASTNAFGAVG